MIDAFLKSMAFGWPAILGTMGIFVTLRQPTTNKSQMLWFCLFAFGGIVGAVAAIWLSDRQEKELEVKLTGGDNYAYLHADKEALKNRASSFRMWVCSTGAYVRCKNSSVAVRKILSRSWIHFDGGR
jgi:hypothetical protein